MLAVDGQEGRAGSRDFPHDEFTGDDEDFLAGQGDGLAGLNGCKGRSEGGKAGYGDDDGVHARAARHICESLGRGGRAGYGQGRAKLCDLRPKSIAVMARGKADDVESIRVAADHIERLRADGAC